MRYHYIADSNTVLDKILSHPDMLGLYTSVFHRVIFEHHGAFVVLVKHTIVDIETLSSDKSSGSITFVAWHFQHLSVPLQWNSLYSSFPSLLVPL